MFKFRNTIIYLIGFAGVGKYTIAKEIANKANFKIVDNHLINNPVFSIINIDNKTVIGEEVLVRTRKIRNIVFDTILNCCHVDSNFILTNELIEGKESHLKVYKKVLNLAKKRNSFFMPIRLICEDYELAKRVVNEDRALRFKSTNQERALRDVKKYEILKPNHKNSFSLDVTNITPSEAANMIINKTNLILKHKK